MKRTLKTYTDSEVAEKEIALEFHNKNAIFTENTDGYFIIETSGKHMVYFTLWRYRPSSIEPYKYLFNLSQDLGSAIDKAIKIAHGFKVILYSDENKNQLKIPKLCVPFGKYKGMTLAELFELDKSYLIWLANNYEPKSYKGKFSKTDLAFKDLLNEYKDLSWNHIIQENRQKYNSEFLELNVRMKLKCKVIKITKKVSLDEIPYTEWQLQDETENRFIKYGIIPESAVVNKEDSKDIKVGTVLHFECIIEKHIEKAGIKYNKIGRILKLK